MITQNFAASFAKHWIAAWNSHDIDEILSHYHENFSMNSPVIVSAMQEESGRLVGKKSVKKYWLKALTNYPELTFTLLHTMVGASSITLIYQGVRGLSAETFVFDGEKVIEAFAHYEQALQPALKTT